MIKKVAITLPTYNEKDNIIDLLERLKKLQAIFSEEYQFIPIIIDDNSPDGTSEVVTSYKKNSFNNLIVITRYQNRGRGYAGIEGFKSALEIGADYIVEMDADLSHNPIYIPRMLKLLDNNDVVLGSRLIKHGIDTRSFLRKSLTLISTTYARWCLLTKIKDVNSGFRAYKKDVIRLLPLDKMKSKNGEIVYEVLFNCIKQKFRISETPIIFEDRTHGTSKLTFKRTLKNFIFVTVLFYKRLVGVNETL